MRISIPKSKRSDPGYALLSAMVVLALTMVVLASIGTRTMTSSNVVLRNNAFNAAVGAAESATEVVVAQMSYDFLHQALSTDVSTYSALAPATVLPGGWPASYLFSDGQGNPNATGVSCLGWQQWTNLDTEFTGLYGLTSSYQITSNAKSLTGIFPVAAGVQQSVQLTSIPVFQFAIFYDMDLEINPGAPMVVTGKTHGNANLYLAPSSSLEFADTVSASGTIFFNRDPNDPTGGGKTTPIFDKTHSQNVSSMTLPIGTDNNPSNVVQILDAPPAGELPSSAAGKARYYNKCDLVIIATNDSVTVGFNNYEDGSSFTPVPTNTLAGSGSSGYTFINTNAQFYDYREGKTVLATEIDVGALTNWLGSTNASTYQTTAQATMHHAINSIYVDDRRTGTGALPAVRVTDGRYLPAGGLTVATPRPLYVRGDFNAPDLTPGLTNTSQTAPASLASDAITVLSPNWRDTYTAGTSLSSRPATNTTVNAAFLTGIVPSTTVAGQGHYSGGVENFARFLETWSSTTLTYNGSMVGLFPSRYATNFWIAPGNYYNPPTRKWAFDVNFLVVNKLPPATPQVTKLQRGVWNVIAANSP